MTTPRQDQDAAALAIAAATHALGLEHPEVTPLEGGVANRSYRLREGPREFVLRVPGDAARVLGASGRSELAMQSLAAEARLAPRIVLAGPTGEWVVSEFADGRTPAADAMREHPMLRRIGAWFARLHALEAPAGLPVVDFGERAAAYLDNVAPRGPDGRIARMRRELARRRAALAPPERIAACHHDPHRRNFIDDGARILAVDWEYAGPGDPAADLAACAGYHALGEPAVDALLEGYGIAGAGAAGVALRARVAALAWIFDSLWFGWNAAAAGLGLPPDAVEQSRLAARLGA
jgi:aminoglycoside phosphotransferase (APT) family kinase protein